MKKGGLIFMEIQTMVDCIVNIFSLSFPFALIFWLVERVTFFFMSLVSGKEVRL